MNSTSFRQLLFPTLALVFVVLVNGLLWIHLIPGGRAPDEVNHLRMVYFIANENRLPVLDQDIHLDPLPIIPDPYVTHPPAGYVFSAAVSRMVPGQRPEIPARYGSLLALVLSVPFMVGTVRLLMPGALGCQICIPAICLLIPQVTFVGAYANSDAFALLTGVLFTFALCWGACRNWTWMKAIFFGVVAGIVMLSRYNSYALLPVYGLAFAISVKFSWKENTQQKASWAKWSGMVAVAALFAVLVASPWFAFNWKHYGELIPLRALSDAQTKVHGTPYIAPKDEGFTYMKLLLHRDWIASTFRSFFGNFDYMSVPLPSSLYCFLAFFSVVSFAALGGGLVLCHRDGSWRFARMVQVFPSGVPAARFLNTTLFVGVVALAFLALHVALTRDYQAQGRYLFPGLLGCVLLAVLGLHVITPSKWRAGLPYALVVLMGAINVYASIGVIAPEYAAFDPGSLVPALETVTGTPSVRITREWEKGRILPGLFVHGGSSCVITVTPSQPRLAFEFGLEPGARGKSDGVRFLVRVTDSGTTASKMVFDQLLSPGSDTKWSPALIDLSAYMGRPITLEFAVDPAGTNAYDWAVFLNPRWSN